MQSDQAVVLDAANTYIIQVVDDWWCMHTIGGDQTKQASKFIRQKQYYDDINTKCKQYNGRLPEGNPSIELVAYSKI